MPQVNTPHLCANPKPAQLHAPRMHGLRARVRACGLACMESTELGGLLAQTHARTYTRTHLNACVFPQALADGQMPRAVYGAEHLARLMVKLPDIIPLGLLTDDQLATVATMVQVSVVLGTAAHKCSTSWLPRPFGLLQGITRPGILMSKKALPPFLCLPSLGAPVLFIRVHNWQAQALATVAATVQAAAGNGCCASCSCVPQHKLHTSGARAIWAHNWQGPSLLNAAMPLLNAARALAIGCLRCPRC